VFRSLNVCVPLTQRLLDAIGSHAGRPHLHLLHEGSETQVTVPMPMVCTLKISASLIRWANAGTDELDLRALFDACPNLRHLSVSLKGFKTGCSLVTWRRGTTIVPFTYTKGKRLPLLESLSLRGYSIEPEEVSHWRDGFPWKSLKSLTLGPDSNKGFLKMIPGRLLSLKTFEISTWNPKSKCHKNKELDAFLLAFNTLETLTVTGYIPSNAAISNHRQLKHLLLHQIEQPDKPRGFLAVDDLRMLDEACPDLEQLELDISQDQDGKWVKCYHIFIISAANIASSPKISLMPSQKASAISAS
jgi:hypothetical protein